jgi:hypothetical protein
MWPIVSERIDRGDEMPQLTVGVHQRVDPLVKHVGGLRHVPSRRSAGCLCLCRPDLGAEVKACEKGGPLRIQRPRVLLVVAVQTFRILCIGTMEKIS